MLLAQDIEHLPYTMSKESNPTEFVTVDWNIPVKNRGFDGHGVGYPAENIDELHSKFVEFFDSLGHSLTVMHRKRLLPFNPTLLTERIFLILKTLSIIKRDMLVRR